MSKNQRKYPREEIQIEVVLSFLEDTPRTVITHDMSEGGLFMNLNDIDHYPLGEMVNVQFKNPLDEFKETYKDAIIVRRTDTGIAIAFVEMEEF